jgi:hypothetical protein
MEFFLGREDKETRAADPVRALPGPPHANKNVLLTRLMNYRRYFFVRSSSTKKTCGTAMTGVKRRALETWPKVGDT